MRYRPNEGFARKTKKQHVSLLADHYPFISAKAKELFQLSIQSKQAIKELWFWTVLAQIKISEKSSQAYDGRSFVRSQVMEC